MSLEVEGQQVAALRARAHPLRLRMLSLLTGAAMSAAELGRELGVSQALASYHLRQLADAEVVELAEQRSRRGGRERRYRYRVPPHTGDQPSPDAEGHALFVEAVIEELRLARRTAVTGNTGAGRGRRAVGGPGRLGRGPHRHSRGGRVAARTSPATA